MYVDIPPEASENGGENMATNRAKTGSVNPLPNKWECSAFFAIHFCNEFYFVQSEVFVVLPKSGQLSVLGVEV